MAVFLGTDVFSLLSCLMAADTTGGLTSDAKEHKGCYLKEDVTITWLNYFLTNQAMENNVINFLKSDLKVKVH